MKFTNRTVMLLLPVALAAGVALARPAQAQTVYTNRAAFDAAVTGTSNRTFAGLPVNSSGPVYMVGPVTFDYTAVNSSAIIRDNFFSGMPYLAASGGTGRVISTTTALGFNIGSVDTATSFNYTFAGATRSFTVPVSPNTSFLGFVNTAPIDVRFAMSTTREFDIVTFVTGSNIAAAPEPATWGLMILGFGLVGAALRRRGVAPAARPTRPYRV